jgi:hypothetical protein
VEIAAGENEEEAATRLLLEREVKVPECDEATCVRLNTPYVPCLRGLAAPGRRLN